MPKITVRVPHNDPKGAIAKIRPALEKTVSDFQGHDLELYRRMMADPTAREVIFATARTPNA
jgi:hypothetical protein